nr:MAG TPA: hypothetical protein [Caudoviricetes sp.]
MIPASPTVLAPRCRTPRVSGVITVWYTYNAQALRIASR